MGMVHDPAVVQRVIRRKDQLQGTQACAQNRVIPEYLPSVVAHGGPFAAGNLQRWVIGNPLQYLLNANPSHCQESP